jgi:hypothetical protein
MATSDEWQVSYFDPSGAQVEPVLLRAGASHAFKIFIAHTALRSFATEDYREEWHGYWWLDSDARCLVYFEKLDNKGRWNPVTSASAYWNTRPTRPAGRYDETITHFIFNSQESLDPLKSGQYRIRIEFSNGIIFQIPPDKKHVTPRFRLPSGNVAV